MVKKRTIQENPLFWAYRALPGETLAENDSNVFFQSSGLCCTCYWFIHLTSNMKKDTIWTWIGIIGFVLFIIFYSNFQWKDKNVEVSTFYDGKDGYSLSVPTGNTSVCTWNYTGGNAAIPGMETTSARNTQKHIIYKYDLYDWSVSCVDDFGNHYVGKFK